MLFISCLYQITQNVVIIAFKRSILNVLMMGKFRLFDYHIKKPKDRNVSVKCVNYKSLHHNENVELYELKL